MPAPNAVASVIGQLRSFINGYRMPDGRDLRQLTQYIASGVSGLVARAGGGAPNATPLPAYINRVSTVVTGADSALLPSAIAGASVIVINAGASSMRIFPNQNNQYTLAADTITPVASSTPGAQLDLAANGATLLVCPSVGNWKQCF